MEVACTSMIHAAAPHFLWPFAVRYAAHQLNLWPRISLPETSPTLRWTGKVGDALVFLVWGSRAFVRNTSADKLSTRAIPCVFLGFVPDAPGWQFYHPTWRRVLPSQDVTFDESVPFYRLFPYRSAPSLPLPLFPAPGPPPVDPLPPQGPAPSGVSQVDPLPGTAPVQVDVVSGAAPGAGSGGAEPEGVEPGGAESEGAEPGGAESGGAALFGGPAGASPQLSSQQLREWLVQHVHRRSGAPGAGEPGDAGAGGAAVTIGAGDPTEPGAADTRGAGAGVAGVGGPRAGGAGAAGAGAVDPGAGGAGGTVRPRPYFVPLLQQVLGVPSSTGLPPPFLCPPPDHSQPPLQPTSPLPVPSPYTEQSGGLTERCEPASRPVSPVCTARRAPRSRPPPVPGTHTMALRPSFVPLHDPLPAPPESSLPEVPDLESDRARAASPTIARLLATAVTDPSFESAAASALLAELRSYLGLQITRDRARRTTTLTQSHMVHQVLQRFGFQYSSPQLTPLSISHSLSALPSDESVEPSGPYPELVGCLITLGMGLVLGGRAPVVLTGHADASWVDDSATQRSSQGYTFSLGSGSVSWRSTRSSSVLSSGCEAEIYARAMAAQELRWLTYLLTDLGEQPRSPPVLYVDNKAMIALCQEHRLEHRTKLIALRYFLARELQQRGQLRLAYVATRANTADVFTKALPPGDHQRFVTVLGLSAFASPPSVGGECALGTDVLEDRHEDFECLAAAVPRFASMLLSPEGDPVAPDILTPRSYAEVITGPYSSQWQAPMDAEMASWKSTGTYVDEVPPPGANIVNGMWIFRGVDYFQTFSPTPKMTTLWVLLHVAAQRDYELHSLDLSTAFLQGSLHEEIWTTFAALGFAPATADPSLFLRTDTSLPPLYVLVYVDDLVFATADTEALTLVKSELQKRHTCTDLGPSALRLPVLLAIAHISVYRPLALSSTFGRVCRAECTSGMGLVLGGRGPVVLTGHADASWVDDSATQRSSQGYAFSLGSGSISWRSTHSSLVLSSSCEAEIYVGAMAAQELRWLTYLLTDLGEAPRSPPVLYVDNKAMIALCQEHRLRHITKHNAMRYFLARELQQRGQLCLAYVATRANTTDVFTKALPPGDHQCFVTVLGLVPTLPHLRTA
ncbi:unnamed protein product [Closterium sp. NIES-53]